MHDEVRDALVRAAQGWNGGEPGAALVQATGAFVARALQDPSALGRVAALLSGLDPGAAAWIAVACGTAIERGADPAPSARPVVDLLVSWLPGLPHAGEPPTAAQAARLKLLDYLCQAAVSHLARVPALRERLGHDLPLVERLDELGEHSFGPLWVREALLKHGGALLLIQPTSGQGLRLRYSNVSNCFHLFSLLQTAVGQRLEGGRVPDALVAKVARGAANDRIRDEAWWHYGDARSANARVDASVRGEGLAREIPVIDGVQVMLAWPRIVERTWDQAFLTPHLEAMPADAVVEGELSADELTAWMKRLGIAPAKRRWPWSRR